MYITWIGREKLKRILAILTVMIIGFSGIQVYGEEAFTENESELIYDVSVAENSTIDIGENDPEKMIMLIVGVSIMVFL